MKSDIIFLRELGNELRFLKEQEKDKFISEYRLMIDERYRKGENIKKIIDSLESPKAIAHQIYNESGFNIENLEKKSRPRFLFLKWFTAIISFLPQTLIFIASFTLIISGIIIAISTIAVVALLWINFDPLQAIGTSILALGLLPLIAITLIWIGRKVFKTETFIFKSIWKTLTVKEIKTKQSQITETKNKKIFFIILISICTVLTLGGTIGTFAGEKTIGGASLSGNLLHNQTEILDISELINQQNEPIKISFNSLQNISWYDFKLVEDRLMDANIEISRDHNTKENLKLEYTIKKTDNNKYKIDVNMPWNLLIFNISSNKFIIKYDATKVNFTNE